MKSGWLTHLLVLYIFGSTQLIRSVYMRCRLFSFQRNICVWMCLCSAMFTYVDDTFLSQAFFPFHFANSMLRTVCVRKFI